MLTREDTLLRAMEEELHDLCQPLTALQFRLEVGRLEGGAEALYAAVEDALKETLRMVDTVQRMRERIAGLRSVGWVLPSGEANTHGRNTK